MEGDLLALGRRRRIFEHVSKNPGTYLREMEQTLGLSVGDLQYHLGQLERAGLVRPHDDGRRKGYYATNEVQFSDIQTISLIRMRTPRRIVLFLLTNPNSSFGDIAGELGFTKGACSFQMKRLLRAGVVTRSMRERESVFAVSEPDRVGRILTTYRASIADEVLDNLDDVLSSI